ncbi:alpha/beta hydrolase family protein [Salinibacterium sp. SYSU T00001]|uniref:alpha/beta hydrolase family protein n=1 Tax=Homoserinimonas sedimenticola TaxID=2986805 RepID=UPI002236727F|nr:alpha/beta hydrolase family protein [Salinibacterium sedimenticola]MCW4384812.1 alpha/beta hydrolase family protein [Salinibacterium sedimenticola]
MLLRLVALIAASAILLGLASTIAASIDEPPEASVTAVQIDYDVATEGLPTLSADAPQNPEELAALSGLELLEALARTDVVTLQRFAATYSGEIVDELASPPPADGVVAWWSQLEEQQRDTLVGSLPRLVGNLEGVPYAARDVANRAYLRQAIETATSEAERGDGGRTAHTAAETQLAMLREIEAALGGPGAIPARSLIAVDDSWPGKAVVALGDLDTADYVSYLVPGMFFTVQGQIVDWTEIALDIHRDELALLHSEVAGLTYESSVATVAWMGYETPNLFTVGMLDQAREGSERLEETVAGLRSARAADPPHVSLIAHSYGSTAASLALARGALEIDAIAIVGSPGVGVQRAADFGMDRGSVFVAEASWDPVVDTAFHGADPGSAEFGAVIMGVAGGIDDVVGDTLGAVTGHLGYFEHGSESMRNFALIGLGRGDLVTGSSGRHLMAVGR